METIKTFFKKIYAGWLWIVDVVVWGQWTKFWDWIKLAHSQSDEASSKRLYGGLIVISCLVSFFLFSAQVFSTKAWVILAPYWTFLLIMGVGLISLGVVEKVAAIIESVKKFAIKSETNSEPS